MLANVSVCFADSHALRIMILQVTLTNTSVYFFYVQEMFANYGCILLIFSEGWKNTFLCYLLVRRRADGAAQNKLRSERLQVPLCVRHTSLQRDTSGRGNLLLQSVLWNYCYSLCCGGLTAAACVVVDWLLQSVMWTYCCSLCCGGHTAAVCVVVDLLLQSVLWWTYCYSLCCGGLTATVCVVVDWLLQSVLWWTDCCSPWCGLTAAVCVVGGLTAAVCVVVDLLSQFVVVDIVVLSV